MENKKTNILLIVVSIIVLMIVAIPIGFFMWYNSGLDAIDPNNSEKVSVEIVSGSGIAKIGQTLYEKNLIKDVNIFKIYVKLNNKTNLQAGTYEFAYDMSVSEMIDIMANGKIINNEVKITFLEGKHMRWIAKRISETTNNTEQDVFDVLSDKEYINYLIEKYWFLTEEIQDERIYYPLEGYLFPETYIFESVDVDVKTIFETMLNQTEKVINKYKDQIDQSGLTVHQILTIASIVECEGIRDEDRSGIASVIFNRIYKRMAIQSDVTTYYAIKVDMGERDLYKKELNTYNPYNTRGPDMEGKIPVGPISSISEASINATLNPLESEYIFFVADKNGKVYFTKNNTEHEKIIKQLKDQGLWYTYE